MTHCLDLAGTDGFLRTWGFSAKIQEHLRQPEMLWPFRTQVFLSPIKKKNMQKNNLWYNVYLNSNLKKALYKSYKHSLTLLFIFYIEESQ